MKHYESLSHISKVYDVFLEEYPKMNWLIGHCIYYNGTNDDFTLYKTFQLIAYDDTTVFIVYIKPQFNELNLYDTLLDSIYDTFIVKNIKSSSHDTKGEYSKSLEDCSKFNNKKIITVVFSLDNKSYKMYDWDLSLKNALILEQLRTQLIQKYIAEIKHVLNYYKWYRNKHIDVSSKRFIKDFIIYYKNDKDKNDTRPAFLLRFFQKIEDNIEDLKMYDDKDYFTSKLQCIITNAIDEYFDFEETV